MFFKDLYKAHKLLLAMNNREVLPLRSEFFKHYLFGIIDPSITACIALTQDLSNLLNELGVDRRDPQVFANTNFLYSQAHHDKLLKDFAPIIRDLDSRSFFKAGKSYGALISHLISSVKNEGMGYLAIKGFCNGFENFAQVEDPVDLLTERSFYLGGIAMELLQELATVVSEGEWEEAYENTVTFWEEKGRKVIEQIPSSIWDRLGLYENKHMTEIVGSHILNWIYDEKRMKYIKKHRLNYYTRMKLIKDNLNHLHVIQAGYLYAEFIKSVDASPEDIY